MSKYFIVSNKPDDYGNCITELIETSIELARQYYGYTVVIKEDVRILEKYFPLLTMSEEVKRIYDDRFYGYSE